MTPTRDLQIDVPTGSGTFAAHFRADSPSLAASPEAVLALRLLPSMRNGLKLDLDAPVSSRLADSLPTIVQILCAWDETLPSVDFSSLGRIPNTRPPNGRIASFFSGGVDSFYTLMKCREDITHLVFLRGFENEAQGNGIFRRAQRNVEKVAEELGVELIQIDTDCKPLFRQSLDWTLAHGCFLMAISHLVGHAFDRIYVPATFPYASLMPWGSHPLLDPLWSTESLQIAHHGAEANRVEKVRYLSRFELPLRRLRVCIKQPESGVNCGRCEKCLRTMVNLEVVGALDRCSTLPSRLDLERLSAVRMKPGSVPFFADNIDALKASGRRPDLLRVLLRCSRTPAWRDRLDRRVHRVLRTVGLRQGSSRNLTFR